MECLGGTAVGAFFFVGLRWKAHSFLGGRRGRENKKNIRLRLVDCVVASLTTRNGVSFGALWDSIETYLETDLDYVSYLYMYKEGH